MSILQNETYQQYRDRVLNTKSPSFCGAKWLNATVWLGSGTTASCHHPPAHKIPLEELENNPSALHNTEYKKAVRQQMLDGEYPPECDYCWKVENLGSNMVSDRVYKSIIYSESELARLPLLGSQHNIAPKTLEIAFDATCNFACSYCNPSFSTQWMTDIKKNGPYGNLVSDGAAAYHHDGSWAQPYGLKNENNPYVEAFMKWWESDLSTSLEELRVTGGEATMSQDFWRLMEWFKGNSSNVRLAVNTNLGVNRKLIERLATSSQYVKDFVLYTSNESHGAHSEYIRDGLVWEEWLENYKYMLEHGKVTSSNVMLTINALCLYSITEFMDEVLDIKQQYGSEFHGLMSFNILRFPSFQSVVTLPINYRTERADHLEKWLIENWVKKPKSHHGRGLLHQMEYDGIRRLIVYLRNVNEGHDNTSSLDSRQRDFKTFYTQYDQRRGKSFVTAFPQLANWFNCLPVTRIIPIQSTSGTTVTVSASEDAVSDGWVMKPSSVNPGGQGFIKPKE